MHIGDVEQIEGHAANWPSLAYSVCNAYTYAHEEPNFNDRTHRMSLPRTA